MIKEARMVKKSKLDRRVEEILWMRRQMAFISCSRWWRLNGAHWKELWGAFQSFSWHRGGDIHLPDWESQNELSFQPKYSAWQGTWRCDFRRTVILVKPLAAGMVCMLRTSVLDNDLKKNSWAFYKQEVSEQICHRQIKTHRRCGLLWCQIYIICWAILLI